MQKRNSENTCVKETKKTTHLFCNPNQNYLTKKNFYNNFQLDNICILYEIEYGYLLDKSLASLFDVQLRLTLSVTLTGVAVGAGGSGAKSKNPIGTPTILKCTIIFFSFKLNHTHSRFNTTLLKKIYVYNRVV